MSKTPFKQQLFNYVTLFKQLFVDYYKQEKRFFWLIQLLMILSTVTGLFWIMSIVLGVSYHQNPTQTEGLKQLLFSWVFHMPLWQWLLLASLAGIVSAFTLYLSIHFGVQSVLSYQKSLSYRCLHKTSNAKYAHWVRYFEQAPRQMLLRILKQGVQLSGLVARRVTRAFVALLTFLLALVVLLYIDAQLLALLLPCALLYLVALYFINRYTARVSTEMVDMLPSTTRRFNQLVNRVLDGKIATNSDAFNDQYQASQYLQHTKLKYLRRLSEVHVNWLNTLFLVLAIAVIILYLLYFKADGVIDWQHLLFFLISLKYAAGSLQEISATTVAFSRFMPEIQLLYRLLNVSESGHDQEKLVLNGNSHYLVYMQSSAIENFEHQLIKQFFQIEDDQQLVNIVDLREQGMVKSLKQLKDMKQSRLIVDRNPNRLKRLINNHRPHFESCIETVVVFSHKQIKQLSIDEFLKYSIQTNGIDQDVDIDAFE